MNGTVMKPIARILVPVTGTERDRTALATAFAAARPFNAHVEAVLAHPEPQAAVPLVGVPFSLDVVEAIIDGQEKFAQAAEAEVRKTLAGLCREMDVRLIEASDRADTVTCSLRNDCGTLPGVVSLRAQLSDLVVFPPLFLPGFIDLEEAFLNVLTGLQKPVLVSAGMPGGGFARSVAIGWDASPTAARAVSAAMPFLCGAEHVYALEIRRAQAQPGDHDIDQYLSLHGVRCTRQSVAPGALSVGDALAAEAARCGADLLVMGGYGHSHLRETLLGGATSDVLARARIPVFLAH